MMEPVRYCIIGTGFAGACTLWHLVHRLIESGRTPRLPLSAVTIVTVERSAVNGPGYPYASENVQLAHRCNNQASTMAIHHNDFIDWMVENKLRLIHEHPQLVLETHPGIELASWRPNHDEFYPRAMFGLYLEERFREAVGRAHAHGIKVISYVEHEVVDGYAQADAFHITLRSLQTGEVIALDGFDRVLLSTGHWETPAPTGLAACDGYVSSPYPPRAVTSALADLRRSRDRSGRSGTPTTVFIQGMGPSAIDAILTVCDEGVFTYAQDGHVTSYLPANATDGADEGVPLHIVVGSRGGFFSSVRGPLARYDLQYVTEDSLDAIRSKHGGHLRLEPILELLDLELRRATGGAVGWCDVRGPGYESAKAKLIHDLHGSASGDIVHTIVLKARRLRFYSQLTPQDKALYDRALDSHFIRAAVPMPPANAEKLLALMDAGVLTTVTLGYAGPGPIAQEGGGFLVTYQKADGAQATMPVDCVIRATGQDFAVERHPSSLLRNLLRRGEVVPHDEEGYVPGGIALEGRGGYRTMMRVDGACTPSPYLASFGSTVRFWQNERNFAAAFVEAAEWVASEWTEHATRMAGDQPPAVSAPVSEPVISSPLPRALGVQFS